MSLSMLAKRLTELERSGVVSSVPKPTGRGSVYRLIERCDSEVCDADPGGEPDLVIRAESLAFDDWHRGALSWTAARRDGRIDVTGSRPLARSLPTWNLHAPVARRS